MNHYAVRMKARNVPAGIMAPRRTVTARGETAQGAKRRAELAHPGWHAYDARLDRWGA